MSKAKVAPATVPADPRSDGKGVQLDRKEATAQPAEGAEGKPAPDSAPMPAAPSANAEAAPGAAASSPVQAFASKLQSGPAAGRPGDGMPCEQCGGPTTNEGVKRPEHHPFAEYVYWKCRGPKCRHTTRIIRRRKPVVRQ